MITGRSFLQAHEPADNGYMCICIRKSLSTFTVDHGG